MISTMRYAFNEFEFDCSNLVLKKNGQDVALRNNEASLLALLMTNADDVLSKEQILSQVWGDKVVSEQAVFQNISHLRQLLGSDAIKTYPKRGYQWQLALQQPSISSPSKQEHGESFSTILTTDSNTANNTNATGFNLHNRNWLYLSLLMTFIFITTAAFHFIFNDNNLKHDANENNNLISSMHNNAVIQANTIGYLPFVNPLTQQKIYLNTNDINNTNDTTIFTPLINIDRQAFKNAIELEYPKVSEKHALVLFGKMRVFEQTLYLNFSIKGPFDLWSGEISGASEAEITEKLQQHLSQPVIYQLLNKRQSPEGKQANLLIAHQNRPDDTITLGHLITALVDTAQLNKARVMAKKLATLAIEHENEQQLGHAYLHQTEILIRQKNVIAGNKKVALALAQFEKSQDLAHQADAWMLTARLAFDSEDYMDIKSSLLQSASLSSKADDIEREVAALGLLSFLGHQYQKDDDKFFYLLKAKKSMKDNDLPLYHFAIVPFHEAAFADSPSAKEPYLLKVLTLTAATPDHWMAQHSRLHLLEHYLKQQRFTAAKQLLSNLDTDNARNSYLKTLLAKAENNTEAFVHHAKRTFEQAQFMGHIHLTLDAALLLITHKNDEMNDDINQQGMYEDGIYEEYIRDNATPRWRIKRKDQLNHLNI